MIDPRGMSVMDWTDSMNLLLGDDPPTMRLDNPNRWRTWARNIVQAARFSGSNVPDPEAYADWREWANRFNSVIDLG